MAQDTVPAPQQDPVLASAGAAIQQANQAVQAAQARLKATSPYLSASNPQPQMPVPKNQILNPAGAARGFEAVSAQQPQTRAGARNKAVGQMAAIGAGIIGKYMKHKEDEKTQALAMDIHRSLELNSGIDEAQQIIQQAQATLKDPNASPEEKAQAQQQLQQGQAALQKNTKLLESLLHGKNTNDIFKAYDITFGEESKDKSQNDKMQNMHYKAMQLAMKQTKIDQSKALQGPPPNMGQPAQPNVTPESRVDQFRAGMPARVMTNPAYGEAYKQYLDTVKNAQETQKNYLTLAEKYMNANEKLQQEHDKETAAAQLQHDKDIAANARTQAEDASREKVAAQNNLTRLATERERSFSVIRAAQIRATPENNKQLEDVYNQTTGNIKDLRKNIAASTAQLEKMQKDDVKNEPLRNQLQQNLQGYQNELQNQLTLQYSTGLTMSGNPQGKAIHDLTGGSGYKSTPVPQNTNPQPAKSSYVDKVKRMYQDVTGTRQPE